MFLFSVSKTITFLQSDPPSDIEYANKLPSSEKDIPAKEMVPSSENLLGSINTSSLPSSFIRYKTY